MEKNIERSIEAEKIKVNMFYNKIKDTHSDIYKDTLPESEFKEELGSVKELGNIIGLKVIVLREKGCERLSSSLFNIFAYYSILIDEIENAQLIMNYQKQTGATDLTEFTKQMKKDKRKKR